MYHAVRKAGQKNIRLIGLTGKTCESGKPGVTGRIDDMKSWETAAELYRELRSATDVQYFRAADLYTEPGDGFKPLWWYHD